MILYIECPQCSRANAKLQECVKALLTLQCLPPKHLQERVECACCKKSGFILTEEGKRFARLAQELISAEKKDKEIPF